MPRCCLCESRRPGDDEVFVCKHCGVRCHRHCRADYEMDVCPRRVGEPMIGAVEY